MKRLDGQDLLVQGLKVAHHDTAHQGIFLWAHLGMMCEMNFHRITCDNGEPGLSVTDLKSKEGEEGQRTLRVVDGYDRNVA